MYKNGKQNLYIGVCKHFEYKKKTAINELAYVHVRPGGPIQ